MQHGPEKSRATKKLKFSSKRRFEHVKKEEKKETKESLTKCQPETDQDGKACTVFKRITQL
jgi:hypothetical protein